jgi:hypothetical protein
MAKAPTQSFDISDYDYDPSLPMPSDRAARNRVIEKGPCQPKDADFPKDKNGRRILAAWHERFSWIEYSKKTDKAF